MDKIRWGILAPGGIARKFALGLSYCDDAELVAVASRAQERADAFGDEWGIPRRHGSYEDLAADPEVDVVYVATPHPFHKANSILCMEAGKAVLCEKPIGINARETEEMIACARANGVFLMEAMWTRFLPAIVRLREMLAAGLLGDVRMLKADFCFRSNGNPEGRLLNPDLGGGALLDVGIYPIAFAYMVFGGAPVEVTSLAHLGETGVDEQAGIVMRFEGDRLAVLTCGIEAAVPDEALVVGTEKWVRVQRPFWRTKGLTLGSGADEEQTFDLPYEGNGYECEARHVMACLRAGRTDSDIMPLAESLSIMRTMDALRAAWGLRYPME
jgi:dihydrodiol dehydrogenase / D-xylose 1-dehydrogenase (NADP)